MKASVLVLAACVALGAVAASELGAASAAHDATLVRLPRTAPAGQIVLYGHVKSLERKGGRFVLRFDPALWLGGVTARRAALEDTGSPDVPNDYYILEEGHRLLSYVVSPKAQVTIVTKGPTSTVVSVPELVQILKGKNPKHRPLFGPGSGRGFGYWIRVDYRYPDAVNAIDQQYQP